MNFNLNDLDKKLLADKLIQLYVDNKFVDARNFFNQFQVVLEQFDIDLNYINNNQNINNIDNILLIQLDSLGDCVLASAFFRELKNNYPKTNIDIIIDTQYKDLLINCPYINNIIEFDTIKNKNVTDVINFCKDNLWNIQYDLAINLNWDYLEPAALLNFLSFSKYRLAYRSNEYERYCCDLQYERQHYAHRNYLDQYFYTHIIDNPFDMWREAERKLWILSILNKKIESNKLEVWFNNDDLEFTKQFIDFSKKNIILGLGGKDLNSKYPVEDLAKAINQINDNNRYIIVDKIDYHDEANLLADLLINKDTINLVNKLTLNQLSALISLSDLYIGNFSGIIHLVEALNKPAIAIMKEAVECEADHPGYLSLYNRYKPKNNNIIILRPEYCIDKCIEIPVFGGCCSNFAHCITQILPDEIVEAYTNING